MYISLIYNIVWIVAIHRNAMLWGASLLCLDSVKFISQFLKFSCKASNSTLSDSIIPFFKGRHSGRDCRNPGPRDELKIAVLGAGCPLPGEHDEVSDNLTK